MIQKLFWGIRAIFYKLFFQSLGLPAYMGKPVFLLGLKKINIGKRVRIFPGLRMEAHGKNAHIVIKDNIGIGQNVHITAIGELVINEGTTILGNVFITDIEHSYMEIGKPVSEQKIEYRKTEIGKNCFIGYGSSIQAGTILGEQCIVGTNAVVRGTFPAFSVVAGVPARIIKQYDTIAKVWRRKDGNSITPPIITDYRSKMHIKELALCA